MMNMKTEPHAVFVHSLDGPPAVVQLLTDLIHRGFEESLPALAEFPPVPDVRRLVLVIRAEKKPGDALPMLGCVEVATDAWLAERAGEAPPQVSLAEGTMRILTIMNDRTLRSIMQCPPELVGVLREGGGGTSARPRQHAVVEGCLCPSNEVDLTV